MDKQYIYSEQLKHHIKEFDLEKNVRTPQKVMRTKWVTESEKILHGGLCTFKGGIVGTTQLILDFGSEDVGHFQFEVSCSGKTIIKVLFGENYEECERENDFEGVTFFHPPKDIYEIESGTHILKSNGRRAFRYMNIQVVSTETDVQLGNIIFETIHYPIEYRGNFCCSDDKLNKIWDVSRNTVRLCMQSFYEDGIKRDGLLWISDYRVEYLVNAMCFGDMELAKKCLFMFASTQTPNGIIPACATRAGGHIHPHEISYMFEDSYKDVYNLGGWVLYNYTFDFVSCIKDYYMYTGDEQTTLELLPFAMRIVEFIVHEYDFKNMELHGNIYTDCEADATKNWASAGTVIMQASIAIDSLISMAEFLDYDIPLEYIAYNKNLKQVILKDFYSEEKGCFVENPEKYGHETADNMHINAHAIISGLIENTQTQQEFIKNALNIPNIKQPTTGFMQFWVDKAVFMSGLTTEALNRIRWYFGYIFEHDSTTCWEKRDVANNYIPLREDPTSLCHGWSGGSAFLLPSYVLGVEALKPGMTHVKINPQLADLEWAEGVIPTPHGDIFVHWDRAKNGIKGYVELPENVSAEIEANGKTVLIKHGEKYSF